MYMSPSIKPVMSLSLTPEALSSALNWVQGLQACGMQPNSLFILRLLHERKQCWGEFLSPLSGTAVNMIPMGIFVLDALVPATACSPLASQPSHILGYSLLNTYTFFKMELKHLPIRFEQSLLLEEVLLFWVL